MTSSSSSIPFRVAGSLALALLAGCEVGLQSNGSALDQRPESCQTIDFDFDGSGAGITAGQIVEQAYQALGVEVEVWQDESKSIPGLGVAFDSANPTGGDDDLAFAGLGNILINQERFTPADISAGFVGEPDDQAHGALFELRFAEAVCVKSLILLDIDFGESPAKIEFFDAADTQIGRHDVAPMGNNVRLDVSLPARDDCNVRRMTVYIDSSGAMDNVEICRGTPAPEIWTRILDDEGDEEGNGVVADSQRNVAVAGNATRGADTDGIVRRYSPSGLLQWSTDIDFGPADTAAGVAVDCNDELYVTGRADNTDGDIYLRKFDTSGTEVWTRLFDGGGDDAGLGVATDLHNNVVIAGFATVGAGTDIIVRKYDNAGALAWTRSADVGARDIGFAAAVGADGQVAVAGQTDNGSDVDFWVRLYDADGNERWTRIFDGGGDDVARGVSIDDAGNVVAAGHAFNGTDSDIVVRSYNPDGTLRWVQTFNSGGVDMGRGVATDAAGDVIVTGSVSNATLDGWTRKYDTDGNEQWTDLFDRGGRDQGNGVATDIAGSVLVTGYFDGVGRDLWLEKLRP